MQKIESSNFNSLRKRIEFAEAQSEEQTLTLVEILANANFFGQQRKDSCKFLKKDLCTYYSIPKERISILPMMIECKIEGCGSSTHFHIRATNIGCCLCNKEKPITK